MLGLNDYKNVDLNFLYFHNLFFPIYRTFPIFRAAEPENGFNPVQYIKVKSTKEKLRNRKLPENAATTLRAYLVRLCPYDLRWRGSSVEISFFPHPGGSRSILLAKRDVLPLSILAPVVYIRLHPLRISVSPDTCR